MRQDSGAGATEGGIRRTLKEWREWLSAPRHVLIAAAAVLVGGLLLGYLLTMILLFPPEGAATDLIEVPDLVGRSTEEARQVLSRRGLQFEEGASFHHPDEPKGTVVAQDPLPGQRAQPASTVRATVSAGPKQRPVPDVLGLDREQATIALERAGFSTDVTFVDAESDVGKVVSTRPASGKLLGLPGHVQVLVSAGRPRIDVPDLVNQSLPEARGTLERLGLELGPVARDSTSQAAPGTILDQSPAQGATVERGTRVAVTVAVVPPPPTPDDTTEIDPPEDTTEIDPPEDTTEIDPPGDTTDG